MKRSYGLCISMDRCYIIGNSTFAVCIDQTFSHFNLQRSYNRFDRLSSRPNQSSIAHTYAVQRYGHYLPSMPRSFSCSIISTVSIAKLLCWFVCLILLHSNVVLTLVAGSSYISSSSKLAVLSSWRIDWPCHLQRDLKRLRVLRANCRYSFGGRIRLTSNYH